MYPSTPSRKLLNFAKGVKMSSFPNIILTSIDDDLLKSWEASCGDLDFVEVYKGSILDVDCDAVVSPANSFGFMDGGIDMVYSRYFGWDVQDRLQDVIRSDHNGELLVGNAEIVETGDLSIPYLISAPTMRVPMILRDSVNAYLSARAVFLLVRDGLFKSGLLSGTPISSVVKKIAFPGLGTGCGRMPSFVCARQVRGAIDDVILGGYNFPSSWHSAQGCHQLLYRDRVNDLQFEQ